MSCIRSHKISLVLRLIACVLTGCISEQSTDSTATLEAVTPRPTVLIGTPTKTATPEPTLTRTPKPIDYAPMVEQIEAYVRDSGLGADFDMAVGFVDAQTGQIASFDGETRHLSLSTFKGPLGAYYLWLVEQGELKERDGDAEKLEAMLNESNNAATACIFKRVGGLEGFNDWLADVGMSRENNFVAQWQNYGCSEAGVTTFLPIDTRYSRGDAELGIPGNYAVQTCEPGPQPCAEAFTPVELAQWYVDLYQGRILDTDSTERWLELMVKKRENIALIKALPPYAPVRAYVKNGFDAKDSIDPLNYYHEAGIIETPEGVFALAVFTQGNPEFPGTRPLAEVGRIVYEYFVGAHQ